MPAATILFVAQPIKQGVRGIGFWNFSLLEHPTINTKEFQNGKKAAWNSGIRKEMPMVNL